MSGLVDLLQCPGCGAAALAGEGPLVCGGCGRTWEVVDGIPVLVEAAPDPVTGRIAGYYDAAAGDYEQAHGIGRPGGDWSLARHYVPFLRRHLRPADTILEIGAGTGRLTRELVPLVARVIAADIAPGMLRWGKEHHGLGDAVAADAERLPFRAGVFDVAVAMNALSYCVHKDVALREARRVLKPGGLLLLIDMNYLLHVPYLLLGLKEWGKARLWTGQLLESTPWGWRRRLSAAGFAIAEQTEMNWVPHRFAGAALRAMIAADAVLSRLPIVRRCAMRIAVAARAE